MRNKLIIYLIIFVVASLMIISFLSGCDSYAGKNIVICFDEEYSSYPEVVSKILPDYSVLRARSRIFYELSKGAVTEAFENQATSALETGVADFWYPQYLATVIIAIDRDLTNAAVTGWRDLLSVQDIVGFIGTRQPHQNMLMSAIAYGLDGDRYDIRSAASLLHKLREDNRLISDSSEPPILICYDYNAAELIKSGRNLEIIIPSEGTLIYTKGLLSNYELSFSDDFEVLLLQNGFRLTNGQSDSTLYPDIFKYDNAYRIIDFEHFNRESLDSTRVFRRDVLNIRMYTSADAREHQYSVLLYIVVVVLWISSIVQRTIQPGIRKAIILTGIILLGWIIVRLINFQLLSETHLLWYSYYIFQLSLPLAVLWLAWNIGNPDEGVLPKWIRVIIVINSILLALILTNDLHNFVFRFTIVNADGAFNYTYGFIFYIVQLGCWIPLIIGIILMLYKRRFNLRKNGFVFPLFLFGLLMAYTVGYILRIPIAWESDMTMVTGIFTLLFLETSMRSGMIPVNTKYTKLFSHSSLNMQIKDKTGNTIYFSTNYQQDEENENIMFFTGNIPGGIVLWSEDISGINHLHKEIKDTGERLAAANTLLIKEEKIKRTVEEETQKAHLISQLESEFAEYLNKFNTMIEQLENEENKSNLMVQITLLLAFIKRRSNLFFHEKDSRFITSEELLVYLDEIIEIAGYSNTVVAVTGDLKELISIRHATLFYTLFYNVISRALGFNDFRVLAYIGYENDNIILRIRPADDSFSFILGEKLHNAILLENGTYVIRELGDNEISINLFFSEGDEIDD